LEDAPAPRYSAIFSDTASERSVFPHGGVAAPITGDLGAESRMIRDHGAHKRQ
jgi:hypothetical protein